MHYNLIKWADVFVSNWSSSKKFYSNLFDWQFLDQVHNGRVVYSLACLDGNAQPPESTSVAGMGRHFGSNSEGKLLIWQIYVMVKDLTATLDKVRCSGGTIALPPTIVMEAGTMAICTDSEGVTFNLWQPNHHSGARIDNLPGSVCWFELTTQEPRKSIDFYSAVFGWEAEQTSESNDDPRWVFKYRGHSVGGVYTRTPETADYTVWIPYFLTENLKNSLRTCKERRGSVLFGPKTEPGIGAYAIVTDAEQHMFGITEYST